MTERVKALTFEDYLKENKELVYTCRGRSMLPLLREKKDLIMIGQRPGGRLEKYDVVLYLRTTRGRRDYVLHRIVQVRQDDYVILGDNCLEKEYGITDGQIIGVMKAFVRNGRKVSVHNPGYRLYSSVWVKLYPVRKVFLKARYCLGKISRTARRKTLR